MPRALHRLSKAIKLSEVDSAAADELCAAIRHYISERLDVPAAGITPEDARHLLAATSAPATAGATVTANAAVAAGAPDDPAGELCRLFEHYFNAGFSTRTELKDLGADCRKLKKLIREIDQRILSRLTMEPVSADSSAAKHKRIVS
jgi:hypothetical protein